MSNAIPAYYYPTTIAIIDDNKRFLSTIGFKLDECFTYRLFDSAEKALDYFQNEYTFNPIVKRCFTNRQDETSHLSTHYGLQIDFEAIGKEVMNANRFDEIAVMMVDYNMPTCNGIEFCKQMQHLPIKKMLVTGAATQAQAVDAFNQGLIDKFILKDTIDFGEQLNRDLTELRHRYFRDISEGIIRPLLTEKNSVLNKPAFADFFNAFCKQHDIFEFFLYDAQGSFLLVNVDGEISWLIIKSHADLNGYLDLAENSDAPASVLADLKAHTVLPFFPSQQDLNRVRGEKWKDYLHPAQLLAVDPAFSYAFIQNKNELLLDYDKIRSYQKHMNRTWPH